MKSLKSKSAKTTSIKSKSANTTSAKTKSAETASIKAKSRTQKSQTQETWPKSSSEFKNYIAGASISFLGLIAVIFLLIFFCESLFSLIKGESFLANTSFTKTNSEISLNNNEENLDSYKTQEEKDLEEIKRLSNLIYFGNENGERLVKEDSDLNLELDANLEPDIDLEFGSNLGLEANLEEKSFMTLPEGEKSLANLNFLNSPDGSKFAFIVDRDGKQAVLLNGDLSPFYDSISFMMFSPDSRRFAYGARVGSDEIVVLDGLPGVIYDWVLSPKFFTPDSKYFVYKARITEGDFLVFNEEEGKIYDQIYTPFVNSDESALIFYARRDQEVFKSVLRLK